MKKKILERISVSMLVSSMLCTAETFGADRINKIYINGNKRVEVATIENYLNLKVGDNYDVFKQSNSIKNLYSTSLFNNIKIDFKNGNLYIDVIETPFVSKIEFKGNSKIKAATFLKEILSRSGESLSNAKIIADSEKIKELYKRSGRFSINVNPMIEELENNRVKVIFKISEGPKTGIKRIYFSGNKNYRDSELKSIILTKESSWLKFLDTNDTYDPDRIEYDKELIKEFYNSVGFADCRVLSATAELTPTKEYFTVTYSIEEGDLYNIGSININNKIDDIAAVNLEEMISIKTGDLYNIKAINSISAKMTDFLATKGYPQVQVYPETVSNQSRLIDVQFVVDKADKIFINKINIEGNVKTEDHVIRREFRISEGDIYNQSFIERAEQNLRNLNYFEKVSVKMLPSSLYRDRYDIDVQLEEKSTSSIGLDLGYNTVGGLFTSLSFQEINLLGTGKYLNTGVRAGKKNTNYFFGITDPYFLDRDLSLGFNLFKSQSGRNSGFLQAEQSYSQKTVGLTTTLGYDITEDLNHSIDYTIKKDTIGGLSESDANGFPKLLKGPKAQKGLNSRMVIEEQGTCTTSSIGQTFTYSKVDSKIIPKNGYLVSLSQEYAGIGGNNKYLKHEIEGKYFKSFVNNKITLKLAANAGNIIKRSKRGVRINDRFNLGDYTLRGFEFGGIGPRDKATGEGLGGKNYYSMSAELEFPVGAPEEFNLKGAAFFDLGSVWDIDIRHGSNYTKNDFYNDKTPRSSIGLGVILITRIAPIRVDWAYVLNKKRYDKRQNIHIKFSTHI